ncbi:hypothetical protein EDD76_11355 [Kineothrix alysoides]|uniref:YD repeat-containing protein n=1 Tax=Kineothrix alysoides TaxID=1469948 RepID=A0A4R1QSC0_9FIRM|nr:hypothetical protein [Kineothrix alysoides]TCL55921.1 hypothetical protein EDD76_11355 [Kineothrix alysoides]
MNIVYKPYLKLIVVKVDHFNSEIIDERNFGYDEDGKINKFKHKYVRNDNYTILSIDM